MQVVVENIFNFIVQAYYQCKKYDQILLVSLFQPKKPTKYVMLDNKVCVYYAPTR